MPTLKVQNTRLVSDQLRGFNGSLGPSKLTTNTFLSFASGCCCLVIPVRAAAKFVPILLRAVLVAMHRLRHLLSQMKVLLSRYRRVVYLLWMELCDLLFEFDVIELLGVCLKSYTAGKTAWQLLCYDFNTSSKWNMEEDRLETLLELL